MKTNHFFLLKKFAEPPTLHGDADDLSETHAELPEKSNYVPRLPSMRNEDDSHFFGYFTVVGLVCIAGYVGYHNKQKVTIFLFPLKSNELTSVANKT